MDHPRPWLRYVAADDLDNETIDLDGIDVENAQGEKLGDVDGFIVDVDSGRPYYVVVDAGGWFRSKNYLLPVGHARLDYDRRILLADLGRDRIERFPGFDKDEFERLSDDELKTFAASTASVCCPDDAAVMSEVSWEERWSHYREPEWWDTRYVAPDRAPGHVTTAGQPGALSSGGEQRQRERAVGHAPRQGESSPHLDGRAQPGDVVGIETGGERTYVGDTTETENKRREEAERDAEKQERGARKD